MNKVILIGCPGSGKSTLAKKLGVLLDLPVHYLDTYYWKENWTETPLGEFNEKIEEVLKGDKWIVDGNFTRNVENRVRAADLVIVFDLPKWVVLWRSFKRYMINFNRVREDMGGNNKERLDWNHMKFVMNFPKEKMFHKVYENLNGKELVILKSQKDTERLLERFRRLSSFEV